MLRRSESDLGSDMARVALHVVRLLGALAMVLTFLAATPTTPAEAASPRLWRAVDSGGQHSCAIRKSADARLDRGLYCWGSNGNAVLGQSYASERLGVTRVGTGRWQSVSASNWHTCGIGMSQTMYCWGWNRSGAIGDGTKGYTLDRGRPVALRGSWRSTSAGMLHTCGIGRSGALYCWGSNEYAQIGDGTRTDRTRPTRIGTRSDWATVTAGGNHTCATKTDGRLFCWGSSYQGSLGLGSDRDGLNSWKVLRPELVDAGVSATTLGDVHSCYLASSRLSCMGDNQFGTGGDGTRVDLLEPTQVTVGRAWRLVSTSSDHTCGVATDRSLSCWGDNVVGQVGDGSRRDRLSPVRVGVRADWSSVSTGGAHTCGLKTDGRIYCWGSNAQWQTGTSARGPFVEPRLVS